MWICNVYEFCMYLVNSISFTIFYCLCYFFIPSAENVIPVFLGSYSYIVWLNSDPISFWKCSLISSAFVLSTVTKSPSSSFALFFSLLFFHPTSSSVLSVSLSLALVFLSLYLCVVTFNIFLTVLCKFDSRSTACSFAVYSLFLFCRCRLGVCELAPIFLCGCCFFHFVISYSFLFWLFNPNPICCFSGTVVSLCLFMFLLSSSLFFYVLGISIFISMRLIFSLMTDISSFPTSIYLLKVNNGNNKFSKATSLTLFWYLYF